jgi:hypothetical protein
MKDNLIVTLCLFSASAQFLAAFPTPVPKPKQSYREAVEVVMERFAKDSAEFPPRWKEGFPQSIKFTTYQYCDELRTYAPEESHKKLKEEGMEWLLSEWGWLVTIVMAQDLSQSNTYFVRSSGKVELLWETN